MSIEIRLINGVKTYGVRAKVKLVVGRLLFERRNRKLVVVGQQKLKICIQRQTTRLDWKQQIEWVEFDCKEKKSFQAEQVLVAFNWKATGVWSKNYVISSKNQFQLKLYVQNQFERQTSLRKFEEIEIECKPHTHLFERKSVKGRSMRSLNHKHK